MFANSNQKENINYKADGDTRLENYVFLHTQTD